METRSSSLFYQILLVSFVVVFLSIISVPGVLADEPGNQSADHEIVRGTTVSGQPFYYVDNEVIVRYQPELYNNSLLYQPLSREFAREINGTVLEDYGSIGLPGMQLILLSNNTTPDRAIAFYRNISHIEYAQYNFVEDSIEPPGSHNDQQAMGTLFGRIIATNPNDPFFNLQWYLNKIDAPDAWGITTGSPDIEIAVLDSGIDINHQDLANNIDKANASSTIILNHGTECAGVIAATGNNGIGVSGVMWRAKIVPVVIADSRGYILTNYVISGVSQARQYGAKILSCSFGFSYNDLAMQDAFARSDALVICSAGNSGVNDDMIPIYPASYDLTNIISVGASDENDNLAYFSSYGVKSIDLVAPGTHVYTTYIGNRYDYDDGTSFSAPMVAGVAGLIKSKHPELSNAQIKAAILNNVDKISSLNGKILTGGRLNAYKALKSLETPTPTPTPTRTPTPTPTVTPTQTPSVTPTITPTPTKTAIPTVTITTIPTTSPVPTQTPVPKAPPVSSFSPSVTNGGAPLTVRFTDQSSNYPTKWAWDFGDGTASTDKNPVHTYSKTGLYTVRLSVYNSVGGNGLTKWNLISVSGSSQVVTPTPTATPTQKPTAAPTVTPTPTKTAIPTVTITTMPTTSPVPTKTPISKIPPVSAFTASVTNGRAPLTVRFTDQSTNYPTTWSWNFGDGTSSTEQNPVHTYSKTGLYTVKLSVFNSAGGNGLTKWNYISVLV